MRVFDALLTPPETTHRGRFVNWMMFVGKKKKLKENLIFTDKSGEDPLRI
jgi:hypothetical protein